MINGSTKNENHPVLSDEIRRPPLTVKELRERLKHIAGLCWGLSIDLQNEIDSKAAIIAEFEQMEAANATLKNQLDSALKELSKCKNLAEQNATLKYQNEQLAKAVKTAQANRKRKEIDDHAEQLAWERETYGNIVSNLTNAKPKTKKQLATEARAKRKAAIEALPPKERERKLKKRIYQKRYVERQRAKQQAQGGNDEHNEN